MDSQLYIIRVVYDDEGAVNTKKFTVRAPSIAYAISNAARHVERRCDEIETIRSIEYKGVKAAEGTVL